MSLEKFFPVILIVLQALAAVMYMPGGNWSRVIYWFAAAILTAAVTFGRS